MNISRQRKSNLVAFLFGVVLCFFGLLGAEITTRLFWKEVFLTGITYEDNYTLTDAYGITKAQPGRRIRSISKLNKTGTTIYDVVYSIDSYSRRMTPVSKPELRDKYLLFFGCSYTYGEGVQDDQTMPARVAVRATEYRPYNYAFHGHSPAQMLAKMESKTLKNEVKEKEGILIYIFIDDHVRRVIGSMRIATDFGRKHPHYHLDARDQVVRKGNFMTGRPVLRRIYGLLAKSELMKFLKIDVPPVITNRHIHLTARLIEESYRLYKEQFPGGDFYVVIYPGSRNGIQLAKELDGSGIKILDESKIFNPKELPYILSIENTHPSALANNELANYLGRDLNF